MLPYNTVPPDHCQSLCHSLRRATHREHNDRSFANPLLIDQIQMHIRMWATKPRCKCVPCAYMSSSCTLCRTASNRVTASEPWCDQRGQTLGDTMRGWRGWVSRLDSAGWLNRRRSRRFRNPDHGNASSFRRFCGWPCRRSSGAGSTAAPQEVICELRGVAGARPRPTVPRSASAGARPGARKTPPKLARG